MDLGVSGLASGFDWRSLVDQLIEVERTPEKRMLAEQNKIAQRNNAFSGIQTQLSLIQNRIEKLKEASFFGTRLAKSSNETIATATAAANTAAGAYRINVTHLATSSLLNGTSNVSEPLSTSADVSGLVLKDARFSVAVTDGTFTVNGKQISITGTDTLEQVFQKISTATSGTVTAAYDPAQDKITLSSSGEIVLGSATDTSNFLSSARLANNGTSSISSSSALGALNTSAALSGTNLVTDIAAGAGQFKINGVTFAYDPSTDSIKDVLGRINNSAAGVSATYDAKNDRFVLTNKVTGDIGVAMEDVTGNFLAATGLAAGQLQRGSDLAYTINDGEQLTSRSNTITDSSSGITGLSIAVTGTGETTVTVSSDTATLKKAIQDLVEEYNKTQKMIDTQTASSTGADGKVTAGLLAQDSDASEIASRLRSVMFSQRDGLSGVIKNLSSLGFETNGNDNTLSLADEAELDAALADHLTDVQELFTNATHGIAIALDGYLEKTIGDDGTLVTKQKSLTSQSADIDIQIKDLERLITDRRQQLIDSFLAMETVQAQVNQQLSFLQQRFGSSSTSTSK